jgi:hypothetical protein
LKNKLREKIMRKKYHVTLTDSEQKELERIITKRSGKSLPVKRAYILLAADENGEKRWSDARIVDTYGIGQRTVERTMLIRGFNIRKMQIPMLSS